MIKGVIFDMDGVLVDNRDVHFEAFDRFSRRHGVQMRRERLIEFFGRGNDEILRAIWPEEALKGKNISELGTEKEAIYRDLFRERIKPVKGLIDFLKELRARDFKMAVGSSGPTENVDFVVDTLGIRGYFDAIVNGDMVTRRKPDPEIYTLAIKKLGLTPEECLVIEDAPPGIEAAHGAKTKVAVLLTTFPKERFDKITYDLMAGDFTGLSIRAIAGL